MEKKCIISEKSLAFAVRIVNLSKYLRTKCYEKVLSNQILRSGTSIGANVEEANGAQSDKDFVSKMSIAYKECRETKYWLTLLHETKYLDDTQFDSIHNDCIELLKIIITIIKTKKKNMS
jgi:four helix bundle protein